MTSEELPPTADDPVLVLARRIQEVEQEIARVRAERSKPIERSGADARDRIAELEAQVRAAEKKLRVQRALRKPARARSSASPFESTRNTLLAIGGGLTAMGLFVGGLALRDHADWGVVAAVGSPGLIGLLMLLKALTAKTVSDLEAGDF
jgi:hypothetical protein